MPTLLCIDDQAVELDYQRHVLEQSGFRVETAIDQQAAEQILRQRQIDAVVLDYRVPPTNGQVVAIAIRKRFPRMPIFLLSGYIYDIPEYFKQAVDACFAKQDGAGVWLRALRQYFEFGESAAAND